MFSNTIISFVGVIFTWIMANLPLIALSVLIIVICLVLATLFDFRRRLVAIIAITGIAALINVVNISLFIQYISTEISRIFAAIRRFLQPFTEFLIWIGSLMITAIFMIFLAIVAFLYCGYCLFTSLRDPVTSGHSSHQLMNCAFANAVGLSFILLVLSMNADHLRILSDHLPAYITFITNIYTIITNEWSYQFMYTLFSQSDLPLFDSLCITVSLVITVISMAMSVVSRINIDSWQVCLRSLTQQAQVAVLGICVAIILTAISHATEQSAE